MSTSTTTALRSLLPARRRYYKPEDAPFDIGTRVSIQWGDGDGTFDEKWIGCTGVIEYYEYDCGSGQRFPHDPMIGVRFPCGSTEEFWKEELNEEPQGSIR